MSHTITADDKHRVRIPEIEPGGTYQVEHPEPDVFVLRRMKPVEKYKPRLVRRAGRLVSVGGRPLTNDDVRRMLEDE